MSTMFFTRADGRWFGDVDTELFGTTEDLLRSSSEAQKSWVKVWVITNNRSEIGSVIMKFQRSL